MTQPTHTHYIEFHPGTGRIKRRGFCEIASVPSPEEEGNEVVPVLADIATQKFLDGNIVNKTPEEMEYEELGTINKGDMIVSVTQAQWNAVLARLQVLEGMLREAHASNSIDLSENVTVAVS